MRRREGAQPRDTDCVRAAWYERQGAAGEVLEVGELPTPSPAPGEVRAALALSGVNLGDIKKRQDWLGSAMPYPRVVPHSDGAGVIDAVRSGRRHRARRPPGAGSGHDLEVGGRGPGLRGAQAGIRADPQSSDMERILRAFVRALANEVRREYALGLDVGLTENDAAIVQDELGDRGSLGRHARCARRCSSNEWGVTGYGVAEAADAAMTHRRARLRDAREERAPGPVFDLAVDGDDAARRGQDAQLRRHIRLAVPQGLRELHRTLRSGKPS